MWKIYINYGTKAEMDLTESKSFNTKKDAAIWARDNGYPQKCIMRSEEYESRKTTDNQIVID